MKKTLFGICFALIVSNASAGELGSSLDFVMGVGVHELGTMQHIAVQIDRTWYLEMIVTEGRRKDDFTAYQGGRVFYWREGSAISPFANVGVTIWDKVPRSHFDCDKNWMFDLGLGLQLGESAQIGWSHASSAGRCGFDAGYDAIHASLRWRF